MPKEYYNGEPLGGTYASAAQVIFNDLIAQYGASSVQEALEALISRKIETSDIVNVQTNDADKVPSAALEYAMEQKIGATDISAIGDGTLTGAVSMLNSKKLPFYVVISSGGSRSFSMLDVGQESVFFFPRRMLILMFSYWHANYQVVYGTVPTGLTITKSANSSDITFDWTAAGSLAMLILASA